MLAAVVVILVMLWPDFVPFEFGIIVLVAALGSIYRPELVVEALGGPNIRWRALHAGRELQVLVAERGCRSAAVDPEIGERVAAMADLEDPDTLVYPNLLRQVLFADPEAPGMSLKRAQLAEADAALRESLRARPTWERGLQKRLAAATEGAAEPDGAREDVSPS